MCWKTYIKENISPKTTVNDIIAYKVMSLGRDKNLYSYYQEQLYSKNKEYRLNGEIVPKRPSPFNEIYTIEYGFHSYGSSCIVRYFGESKFNIEHIKISYGGKYNFIESYTNDIVLVKCVIPKNTIYYKNENCEIVSDRIIVTDEIIDFKELKEIAKALLGNGTFNKIFKCHNDFSKKTK